MAKQAQIDAVRPVLTALDQEVQAAEHVVDAVVASADKATGAIEAGLETVADVVPEALDKAVHVTADVTRRGVRAFRNPRTTAIIVGVGCVAAGVCVGIAAHQILKKRLELKYEARLETELEEMREYYLKQSKTGKFATPRSAAEALAVEEAVEALKDYRAEDSEEATPAPVLRSVETVVVDDPEAAAKNQAVRYDKVVTNTEAAEAIRHEVVEIATETPGPVERNVFVNNVPLVDDDWDADAEEASRDPQFPYVISHDEYMENSYQHEQESLTYHLGDDVLVDASDDMITDVDTLVGTKNLGEFGHGSRDPNVVYVRNELRETDYEITLSRSNFAEVVMGLRHSDETDFRLRKARRGDSE